MSSMSDYEAREIAVHLVDGGWTSEDKDLFISENAKMREEDVLTEDEIDMVFREIARIEAEKEEE